MKEIYEVKKGRITKNGHVMFPEDVAKELNRLTALVKQLEKKM